MVSLARRPPAAIDVIDVAAARVRDAAPSLAGVCGLTLVPAGLLMESAPLWPQVAHLPLYIAPPVLALTVAFPACVLVLGDEGLGRRPPVFAALRGALKRLPGLLFVMVAGLAEILSFAVLLLLPGIGRIGRLLPTVPVLLLEQVRPGLAMRRARFLMVGTEFIGVRALLGSFLAAVSVAALPVTVLVLAVPLPAGGSESLAATRVLLGGLLVAMLVVPALAATSFAAFLVRREQLEALDLQLALQALDEATPERVPA